MVGGKTQFMSATVPNEASLNRKLELPDVWRGRVLASNLAVRTSGPGLSLAIMQVQASGTVTLQMPPQFSLQHAVVATQAFQYI